MVYVSLLQHELPEELGILPEKKSSDQVDNKNDEEVKSSDAPKVEAEERAEKLVNSRPGSARS